VRQSPRRSTPRTESSFLLPTRSLPYLKFPPGLVQIRFYTRGPSLPVTPHSSAYFANKASPHLWGFHECQLLVSCVPIMTYLQQGVLVVLSILTLALSQQNDPIKQFCRRWGHATAQIDSRLYIDGGMVGSVPFSSNHTSTQDLKQRILQLSLDG